MTQDTADTEEEYRRRIQWYMAKNTRSRSATNDDIRKNLLGKKTQNLSKKKNMLEQERAQEAMDSLTADPVRLIQMMAMSVTTDQ